VDRLCARAFELRLRLRDVGARRDALCEALLRQVERAREGVHGLVEELPLSVEGAELEVRRRERSLQGEAARLQVGGARLRARLARLDVPPDASPQVELPAGLDGHGILVVGAAGGERRA